MLARLSHSASRMFLKSHDEAVFAHKEALRSMETICISSHPVDMAIFELAIGLFQIYGLEFPYGIASIGAFALARKHRGIRFICASVFLYILLAQ